MGLSWQQEPLGGRAVGHFLTAEPLPERLLFAEPLRRRLRVRFAGEWLADSEDVVLLHEPGRYPVAYFPVADVTPGASELRDRVAFAWRAMEAFYEEDERIVGHAADPYHRIDIRNTSRHLVVKDGDTVVADTTRPVVLYESGFAPRWYVPRADIEAAALTAADGQTFCPYKGVASYYDIGDSQRAAWSYPEAWQEVDRVADLVPFEPDKVDVFLDDRKLTLEPGQTVVPHGVDRGLDLSEVQ